MRFSHFVFIAAAILLSSENAIADTPVEGQALMTETDAETPVRALSSNNDKRFLRSYKEEEAYLTEDKYDEEKEERGVMSAAQVAKWTERANEWVREGKTPHRIKDKLTFLNGVMSEKNKEKYRLFLAAWGRANPDALRRN
ncbi:hypothetical protein DVH05_008270 [Phytophthora capsici]|nr:hypothetical protein DVH05_008270 [Phytophthora capsici]